MLLPGWVQGRRLPGSLGGPAVSPRALGLSRAMTFLLPFIRRKLKLFYAKVSPELTLLCF